MDGPWVKMGMGGSETCSKLATSGLRRKTLTSLHPTQVKFYREVELKHGRVAMLASLGFLVGEQFHPLFGGDINVLPARTTPGRGCHAVTLGSFRGPP